jgi:hypothetical protein
MMRAKLSPTELGRIADLLADAASEFANHGCNDFGCSATAENKAIFTAFIKWQAAQPGGDPDPTWIENVENVQGENEEIYSFDHWAMGYFAQRCKALAKDAASAPVLSIAELGIIAKLLDLMVEWREIDLDEHDITVDYTLSATDENKQIIAGVIKHEGSDGWERMVEEVMQSHDEIAVPEHWLMRYFSSRCKELAAQ